MYSHGVTNNSIGTGNRLQRNRISVSVSISTISEQKSSYVKSTFSSKTTSLPFLPNCAKCATVIDVSNIKKEHNYSTHKTYLFQVNSSVLLSKGYPIIVVRLCSKTCLIPKRSIRLNTTNTLHAFI